MLIRMNESNVTGALKWSYSPVVCSYSELSETDSSLHGYPVEPESKLFSDELSNVQSFTI